MLEDIVRKFEPVIDLLPTTVCILDVNSKHCLTSKLNAELTGFDNVEQMMGGSYIDLRCPAADEWESQVEQDKRVMETKRPLDYLCYYQGQDGWRLLYGTRTPLFDNDKQVVGTMYNSANMSPHHLIDISRFLMDGLRYVEGVQKKQFTLALAGNDIISDLGLSERQHQCLFFLIRGKSAKQIAALLSISPKTVESHIEVVNMKFDTYLKSELIEKAIGLGYMNIVPPSLFPEF